MSEGESDNSGRTILFLDIDGVLNDAEPVESIPTTREQWAALLDEDRVARIDEIIDATGASVVLSSSWRQIHSLDDMQELLEMAGFRGTLVDQTPVLAKTRGEQIQVWLAEYRGDVARYVAIDDSPYMSPIPEDKRVKTAGRRGGITEDEKQEAIRKLEAQQP